MKGRRSPACGTGVVVLVALACGPVTETAVFVGSGGTDHVYALDGQTGRIFDTLRLDIRRFDADEPHGLAVAPDGRHLYVTIAHGEPTLSKFELPARRLVGRVALGIPGAGRIGITPDGGTAIIPDYYRDQPAQDGALAVVDLHDLVVRSRPTVCPAPHDAPVSPDGTRVAVTCTASDEVVLVDTETWQVATRFDAGPEPGPRGAPNYRPLNAVWSAAGDRLFVTLNRAGVLGVFGSDGAALGVVPTGAGPAQLALSGDGRYLAVANRTAGTLTVLDPGTLAVERTVHIPGRAPHGVTIGPDGMAYVTYEGAIDEAGGVVGIELQTGEVLWSTPAGTYTLGVTALTRKGATSQ